MLRALRHTDVSKVRTLPKEVLAVVFQQLQRPSGKPVSGEDRGADGEREAGDGRALSPTQSLGARELARAPPHREIARARPRTSQAPRAGVFAELRAG